MKRMVGAGALLVVLAGPATAQTWAPWYQPSLLDQPKARREAVPAPGAQAKPKAQGLAQPGKPQAKSKSRGGLAATSSKPVQQASLFAPLGDPDDDDAPAGAAPAAKPKPKPIVPAVLDGGPRPAISPSAPASVALNSGYGAGTVVIDTSRRKLYLVQSNASALVYPISVGRDGFRWTGTEKISRVANWPDWRPPAEMRERQPNLPEVMTGGVRNPLGAKALYLGNSLYRIHGTNSAQTIGQANSSGCFRMMNSHVVDLAGRVGVGTTVVVKSKL